MALERSELYTVAGVLLILLAMLAFNTVMARRPAPRGGEREDAEAAPALLCKFVTHDGSVVGETVALDGGTAILKQGGVFKAVPADRLKPDGAELVLTGAIDWDEAVAAGAAWHERTRGEGQDEVAGQLTRSEDVRAPALEAFRAREEE